MTGLEPAGAVSRTLEWAACAAGCGRWVGLTESRGYGALCQAKTRFRGTARVGWAFTLAATGIQAAAARSS